MSRPIKQKVGDIYSTKFNGSVEVLEVVNSEMVLVKFLDTNTTAFYRAGSIVSGNIRDPYKILDIAGCVGEGVFSWSSHKNIYQAWRNMLRRCYDTESERYSRYGARGVVVHEDWHNFQNFCLWWINEITKIPVELHGILEIDKDFNKPTDCCIYHHKHCTLLPKDINSFLSHNILDDKLSFWKEGISYRVKLPNGRNKSLKTIQEVELYNKYSTSVRAKVLIGKYKGIEYLINIMDTLNTFVCEDVIAEVESKQKLK